MHQLSWKCKQAASNHISKIFFTLTAPIYTVKKVSGFPVPSRDVTDQTLPGWELLNYSRPGRVWSVTSRLETGKPLTFCTVYWWEILLFAPILMVRYKGKLHVSKHLPYYTRTPRTGRRLILCKMAAKLKDQEDIYYYTVRRLYLSFASFSSSIIY